MSEPQSVVATEFVESRGSSGGYYKVREEVNAIIIHTTGYGPIRRWLAEQGRPRFAQPSPFETAVHRTYRRIMRPGPHYVVGQKGECIQICKEQRAAWHVRTKGFQEYRDEDWAEAAYEWWEERWTDFDSPLQLAGGKLWADGSCNANTLGIEVVPPLEEYRGPWSEECWNTLTALVRDLCVRHQIPIKPDYVLTHSDAHPTTRTHRGVPWDPGPQQWAGPSVVAERFALQPDDPSLVG